MDRLIEKSARLNENIQTFTSNRLHITGKYTMPFSVKKDDMGNPLYGQELWADNMLNWTIMKELVR